MLAGGLKFREGYGRKAYNNILVNNGFHPHVWFADSASEFHHNITMKAHVGIGQPEGWGKLIDRNLVMTEADRARNAGSGGDANSAVGDPKFLDPASGDFRVADDSPVLKLGFTNFQMDRFGVKKPSLKAIAQTPVIPAVQMSGGASQAPAAPELFWLGASLHGIVGEEFSAFGVNKNDAGVQLVKVPADSAAARAGLRANDLIQGVNGPKVSNTNHLFAVLNTADGAPLKLRLIRNQKPVELALPATPFISTETADDAKGFTKLIPSPSKNITITASQQVDNDPLNILTDGILAAGYGPVFTNGIQLGIYKMNLGSAQPVSSISSWSFNQNGNRGRQFVTIYGSNFETDPG